MNETEAETVRVCLAETREILDQAVESARLGYQFSANSYTYDAMVFCMKARDKVAKLKEQITFLTHFADAMCHAQRETA